MLCRISCRSARRPYRAFFAALTVFLPLNQQAGAEWGGVGGYSDPSATQTLNPTSTDTDGDGIPNSWEGPNFLQAGDPKDALSDFDMDGLTALQEYQLSQATSGQFGKHLGKWAAQLLPQPTGFTTATPTMQLIECASNGVILAQVSGRLVGSSVNTTYPYIYTPATGVWTRVAVPAGFPSVTTLNGLDVNASGQVVGYFYSGGYKGFVWTPDSQGGQTTVFKLVSGTSQQDAIPKRISDAGYVVGSLNSLTGSSFAAELNGAVITLPGQWTNPVYYDVNDYGEFVGKVWNPLTAKNETFLAAQGLPVFLTSADDYAEDTTIWSDKPEFDYGSISWESGNDYYATGTAVNLRTGLEIEVRATDISGILWKSTNLIMNPPVWFEVYGYFSTPVLAVNDWGEFAGTYNATLQGIQFDSNGMPYHGSYPDEQGVYFYEGSYHIRHYHSMYETLPSFYGLSNDSRVLIGTPFAIWSGSLVVPIANLMPAGFSTGFSAARIADNGQLVLQAGTSLYLLKPNQDGDGDGMPDDWEKYYELDPNDPSDAAGDADLDGISNLTEFKFRTNPQSVPVPGSPGQFIDIRPGIDTDGDGMPNVWEWKHGLNYDDPSDASADADGDELTNLQEFLLGTHPKLADTDGDGVTDGREVMINFTDPLSAADGDEDGIPDNFEKDLAKQLLASEPDSSYWGGVYSELLAGNLNPTSFYTDDGVSAKELADILKPAASAGHTDSGYLVENQWRRNTMMAFHEPAVPPGLTDHNWGNYAHTEPFSWDVGENFDSYANYNSSYLVSQIDALAWSPTYFEKTLIPWFPSMFSWSWSMSGFSETPRSPSGSQYAGHIWQERFRVIASRADHEPLAESGLKITSRRAYAGLNSGLGDGDIQAVESVEIKIPKHRFFTDWFEDKPEMVDGSDTSVRLLPVDLDIVHPATGELADAKEDVDDGGYVSVQRLEDPADATSDVTPKTKLQIHAIARAESTWKTRLKFSGADRYKIYRDEARTQEVISEQTEFDANQETTLFFHGLKKSLTRGGELVTMQVKVNDAWVDGDSVKCTIVQSEFLIQVKAFIPYAWTEGEEIIGPELLNPMDGKVAKGDLHPGLGDRLPTAGFLNKYSTDKELPSGPSPPGTSTEGLFKYAPFRVCQTVIITPYKELHSTEDIQGKRKLMTAPLSEHFVKTTSVNPSEMSLHMGYLALSGTRSNFGKPPANTPAYEHLSRSGRISEVTIDGGGRDGAMPTGTTWATADIHWRLYLKIWADANPLEPKIEFGGKHDSYPAYEIIVIQSDGTYKPVHNASPAAGARPGPGALGDANAINVTGIYPITQ